MEEHSGLSKTCESPWGKAWGRMTAPGEVRVLIPGAYGYLRLRSKGIY